MSDLADAINRQMRYQVQQKLDALARRDIEMYRAVLALLVKQSEGT